MTMVKKFAALRSRAEQIAEEEKALAEAKKAHTKSIDDALKHAGRARVEFVEKLYEFFGIEQEMTERTNKDGEVVRDRTGEPVMVKTDRNETARIERLDAALARLLDGAEQTGDEADHHTAEQQPLTPAPSVRPVAATADRFEKRSA